MGGLSWIVPALQIEKVISVNPITWIAMAANTFNKIDITSEKESIWYRVGVNSLAIGQNWKQGSEIICWNCLLRVIPS